jgi:hypothetical protein
LPAPAASAQPTQAAPPVARRSREGVLAPDKWLEDILSLRRAGRLAEADAALAEFRKAYPDHPLPPLLSPSP